VANVLDSRGADEMTGASAKSSPSAAKTDSFVNRPFGSDGGQPDWRTHRSAYSLSVFRGSERRYRGRGRGAFFIFAKFAH